MLTPEDEIRLVSGDGNDMRHDQLDAEAQANQQKQGLVRRQPVEKHAE